MVNPPIGGPGPGQINIQQLSGAGGPGPHIPQGGAASGAGGAGAIPGGGATPLTNDQIREQNFEKSDFKALDELIDRLGPPRPSDISITIEPNPPITKSYIPTKNGVEIPGAKPKVYFEVTFTVQRPNGQFAQVTRPLYSRSCDYEAEGGIAKAQELLKAHVNCLKFMLEPPDPTAKDSILGTTPGAHRESVINAMKEMIKNTGSFVLYGLQPKLQEGQLTSKTDVYLSIFAPDGMKTFKVKTSGDGTGYEVTDAKTSLNIVTNQADAIVCDPNLDESKLQAHLINNRFSDIAPLPPRVAVNCVSGADKKNAVTNLKFTDLTGLDATQTKDNLKLKLDIQGMTPNEYENFLRDELTSELNEFSNYETIMDAQAGFLSEARNLIPFMQSSKLPTFAKKILEGAKNTILPTKIIGLFYQMHSKIIDLQKERQELSETLKTVTAAGNQDAMESTQAQLNVKTYELKTEVENYLLNYRTVLTALAEMKQMCDSIEIKLAHAKAMGFAPQLITDLELAQKKFNHEYNIHLEKFLVDTGLKKGFENQTRDYITALAKGQEIEKGVAPTKLPQTVIATWEDEISALSKQMNKLIDPNTNTPPYNDPMAANERLEAINKRADVLRASINQSSAKITQTKSRQLIDNIEKLQTLTTNARTLIKMRTAEGKVNQILKEIDRVDTATDLTDEQKSTNIKQKQAELEPLRLDLSNINHEISSIHSQEVRNKFIRMSVEISKNISCSYIMTDNVRMEYLTELQNLKEDAAQLLIESRTKTGRDKDIAKAKLLQNEQNVTEIKNIAKKQIERINRELIIETKKPKNEQNKDLIKALGQNARKFREITETVVDFGTEEAAADENITDLFE